ncbi:MAG: hypothetical protein WEK74_13540 [Hydrogenophaga sp.]
MPFRADRFVFVEFKQVEKRGCTAQFWLGVRDNSHVVLRLKVGPKPGLHAEIQSQAQGGVGGDGRSWPLTTSLMRLARFFGGDAQSWLNLQQMHDLKLAEQAMDSRIEAEIEPMVAR